MPAQPALELLAPAKNLAIGIEAIRHGADAVYIGGPAFGARAGAGNPVADIAALAEFAHRYRARVFVALNTILRDDELEAARQVAWQAWDAGADALIVQDMGMVELDLPPIELHASTQTDIRTPEKAAFLAAAGFSQIVLARELSLPQIAAIAAQTDATLEFFIHGALCVSYSGQCYISHAQTGRSANRGDCSQACRLPYTLADADGSVIASDQHLLSMKDNDQSANLAALVDAGIRSFKIEGRLKDLGYVKNVTAHYRLLLDALLEQRPELRRASAGRCRFSFTPDPQKSFNRGATDYFVNDRHADIGAFATPGYAGTPIGRVARAGDGYLEIASDAELHNGDGIAYFDEHGELAGLRVDRADRVGAHWRLSARDMPALPPGSEIYRNLDHAFHRQLAGKTADRRVAVALHFAEREDGFALTMRDEDGIEATATLAHAKLPARDAGRAATTLREQLGKLGETIYEATTLDIATRDAWFIPLAALNALRRDAVARLDEARAAARQRPQRRPAAVPAPNYPQGELSYLGNVYNASARAFYARHGVALIDAAYEAGEEKGAVSLMITKHCLRYSFNLCPKQVKGIKPEPMILANGGEKLTLRFDCKRCEMHVVGKLRPGRRIRL